MPFDYLNYLLEIKRKIIQKQKRNQKKRNIKSIKFRLKGRYSKELNKNLIEQIINLNKKKNLYIGASSDFKKRYDAHQKNDNHKNLKYMTILYKTTSKNIAERIEGDLIKKFNNKNYHNKNIIQDGGTGLVDGKKYYFIYMLSDNKN